MATTLRTHRWRRSLAEIAAACPGYTAAPGLGSLGAIFWIISAFRPERAENRNFTIRLDRNFDPAAGNVDLFPQEMTRVLLNLISNGVYAAMKRQAETGDGYEPALVAATRDLGDRVEIRIRDNGSGIPPEVKEKMFNPFFTTKPPGEGTGLGLSLSYDIVVKQHAGSIAVDTRPGEFTEFAVVLPRASAPSRPVREG
jgi:two-component system NtrC family sensor kinase